MTDYTSNTTNIGDGAFAGCTALGAITVDALNPVYRGVDGLLFNQGQTMFIQYPAGKGGDDYIIPDGVSNIRSYAFQNCVGLTDITISSNIIGIGSSAFAGCTDLAGITVEVSNPFYSSVDGVLFDKTQTTLIQCPGSKAGSYTIPNSVTNIGSTSFAFCRLLTDATIPNSVTSMGLSAFQSCANLTHITVGNSLTNISQGAFQACAKLVGITLPNSITSIGLGGLPILHQPEKLHRSRSRHQPRSLRVLRLHPLELCHNPQQRYQRRKLCVLRLYQSLQCDDSKQRR